jgi:PPOX class probable FMN-dependent enzyme
MEITNRITDLAGLRELYRQPSEIAANKVFDTIDEASAAFVDRCPFLVLATTDPAGGPDASPRGGPPGFIHRLDDRHVAIPDLNGNNRLDSLENIVANPRVGLLLVMPGKDETLRINGPATLTNDAQVLDGFTTELRRPKLAIVVEVAELYGHCAKAFRRGKVWDTAAWDELDAAPDLADIVAEQFDMNLDASRARLEESYDHDLALD